jgi:4-amino-4-deoxy-L-arabinose transferase-like glycosyltransferase
LFAAGLLVWIAFATTLWSSEMPLGHDEAQYAIAASEWLRGEVPRWNYLSVGMTAVAAPGVLAGGGEGELRLASALCGIGFVLACAALARRLAGATIAAWAVAVVVGTVCIAKRSADLLSDVPAAACLLAASSILSTELSREGGPRWRLLWVAPWLGAAFYLRYGSCIPIAVLGLVALVGGWRAIRQRPAPVVATVALGAAFLVPYLVLSIRLTGKVLGILRDSSTTLPAELGLLTYVSSNPFTYYGALAAPLMLLGLGSILHRRDRRSVMLWAIAVGDIIAVGLTTLGQSRYILLGIAILLILGVREVEGWISSRPARTGARLTIVALLAVVAVWGLVAFRITRIGDERRAGTLTTRMAAAVIARDAQGKPCLVLGRRATQLEWYSGCRGGTEITAEDLARRQIYAVVEGGPYQPVLAQLGGRQRTLLERPGELSVTRIEPAP